MNYYLIILISGPEIPTSLYSKLTPHKTGCLSSSFFTDTTKSMHMPL